MDIGGLLPCIPAFQEALRQIRIIVAASDQGAVADDLAVRGDLRLQLRQLHGFGFRDGGAVFKARRIGALAAGVQQHCAGLFAGIQLQRAQRVERQAAHGAHHLGDGHRDAHAGIAAWAVRDHALVNVHRLEAGGIHQFVQFGENRLRLHLEAVFLDAADDLVIPDQREHQKTVAGIHAQCDHLSSSSRSS